MKHLLGIFIFCFFLNFLSAQEVQKLSELTPQLSKIGALVVGAQTEEERINQNLSFDSLLYEMLLHDDAFDFDFAAVKNLSSLKAKNKKFRLFTWLVPLKDGTFNYHGYALIKTKNGVTIETLLDQGHEPDNVEYAWLKSDHWFGAIYYDTFEVKYKKQRYQMFLGYRPGNHDVQEKIIEVVALDENKLRFGAKIFDTPKIFGFKYKQRPYRLRFRYAKKAVASVKWFATEEKIIMDHLTPPDAGLMKQWKYYGPDFTYDALYWEKGKWHLSEGVEFNSENQSFSPTNKPKQGLEPKKN